jgi:hypothetical protein
MCATDLKKTNMPRTTNFPDWGQHETSIVEPPLSSPPLSGHTLLNRHILKTIIMLSIVNVSVCFSVH